MEQTNQQNQAHGYTSRIQVSQPGGTGFHSQTLNTLKISSAFHPSAFHPSSVVKRKVVSLHLHSEEIQLAELPEL